MATKAVQPNGDIRVDGGWSFIPTSPTTAWDKIDEASADDDTTCIQANSDNQQVTCTVPAIGATDDWVISSLKLWIRAKEGYEASATIQHGLQVDGTDYLGNVQDVSAGYTGKSYEWTTNPQTTNPWTYEDVNGIGDNAFEGVIMRAVESAPAPKVRITRVELQVNYTIPYRNLIGSSTGASLAVTSMETRTELGGSADGTSVSGSGIKLLKKFDGSSAGTSTASDIPELKVIRGLGSLSAGTSVVSEIPAMQAIRELAGVTGGSSTADAVLTFIRKLAGGADGSSTVIATLISQGEKLLNGQTDGTSIATAITKITKTFIAGSDGISTAGATLETRTELAGASDGTSTVGASLEETTDLSGASDGTSTASTVLSTEGTQLLAGASDGASIVSSSLTRIIELTAISDGLSTVNGVVSPIRGLAGTSGGLGVAYAGVTKIVALSGQSNGSSTASAFIYLPGIQELAVQADGGSTAKVRLVKKIRLADTSELFRMW